MKWLESLQQEMGTLVRGHCQKNKSLVCCLGGRVVTTKTQDFKSDLLRILPPSSLLTEWALRRDSYGESWLGSGNSPFLETEVAGGRERQGRSMLKMSQNMGQIQFPQYVESRGQGEVLRPRECALLWDSMGCLRVTGSEGEPGCCSGNVHSSKLFLCRQ